MRIGSGAFKAIFVSESVPFFGTEGLPIVGQNTLGSSFKGIYLC